MHFDEHVSAGRSKLEKELHRLGLNNINHERVAQKLHFNKLDEFHAAIGRGDVTEHQLEQALREDANLLKAPEQAQALFAHKNSGTKAPSGIMLEGVGNVLTNLARCCKPAPPDAIIGYVTRDRGVTIHRQSCAFIARMDASRHSRLLHAQWGDSTNTKADVDIEVLADDRQGLLRDISDLFARERVNVTKVNTRSRNMMARMQFSVEVMHVDQLQRILTLINQVPGVTQANRIGESQKTV